MDILNLQERHCHMTEAIENAKQKNMCDSLFSVNF